jgi:nucleoside-diphosphate-sugar epimerase
MIKALVTGATGLIGSRLALTLANRGVFVHALCRSEKRAKMLNHPGIRIFIGDIGRPESLKRAMRGCEEVYHLAAFTGVWHRDPGHYREVNVEGTNLVLDMASEGGVRRVVVTSTAGVLGPSGGLPVDETSNVSGPFFTEYEASKVQMEQMISMFPAGDMKIVIVNPSRLYGPGPLTKSNGVTLMLVRYLQGKWHVLPGSGDRIGNYAWIEDVVEGHILAMELGQHGQRYILGGENLSYLELFRKTDAIAGCRHRLFSLPIPLMIGVSALMKLVACTTGRTPLITPGWVRKYSHDWVLSVEKAQRELGYSVTPFEEGIRKIIQQTQGDDISNG